MRKWALTVLVAVLAAAMVSPHAQAGRRGGGGGPQPFVTIGEFSLPPVIGSHMVLQRDMPAPIWGKAAAGTKVTVKFREQSKTTAADAEGKWMVKLDPLKAGGPDVLTITGKDTITLEDVLVGEVWIGSGQSNMDTEVVDFNKYTEKDPVLAGYANKTHPKLRLLVTTGAPGWKEATPENIGKFSALLFSFGVPLQKELDIPVGLIEGVLMCALINGWRKDWGQDFSFIYVQKSSGPGCAWDKDNMPAIPFRTDDWKDYDKIETDWR